MAAPMAEQVSCPCGGSCRCHAISATRRGQRVSRMVDWRPEEDAYLLRRLDDGDTLEQARVAVNDRFERTRSLSSIRDRVVVLGRSFRDGWYSAREVACMLGVDPRQVTRWHQKGALAMTRHKGGVWWRVSKRDLEAFVKAHAGRLFDPVKVTDRHLRSLAEVAARVNLGRSA